MTCRMCQHEFCWKCSSPWTRSHSCSGKVQLDGVRQWVTKLVGGPTWAQRYCVLSATVGCAMLFGYAQDAKASLETYDMVVECFGASALVVSGFGLGFKVLSGRRRERMRLVSVLVGISLLAAVLCLLCLLRILRSQGDFAWGIVLWSSNLALAVHACAFGIRRKPTDSRVAACILGFSPIIAVLGLHWAFSAWLSSGAELPESVPGSAALPNMTLDMHSARLSSALETIRELCTDCTKSSTLSAALHDAQQAAATLVAESHQRVADMQSQIRMLEETFPASPRKGFFNTGAGYEMRLLLWGWVRRHARPIVELVATFASLAFHSRQAFCCLVGSGRMPDEPDKRTEDTWRRALALSRSMLVILLVIHYTKAASWPLPGAGMWLAARLWLMVYLFASLCKHSSRMLAVPIFLAWLPALGLREVMEFGLPVELIPLLAGGAALAALSGAKDNGLWRWGALAGFLFWLGPQSGAVPAMWAGMIPLTAQLILVSSGMHWAAPM